MYENSQEFDESFSRKIFSESKQNSMGAKFEMPRRKEHYYRPFRQTPYEVGTPVFECTLNSPLKELCGIVE